MVTRPLILDEYDDPPQTSLAPKFQEVIEASSDDPQFLKMRQIALRLVRKSREYVLVPT